MRGEMALVRAAPAPLAEEEMQSLNLTWLKPDMLKPLGYVIRPD